MQIAEGLILNRSTYPQSRLPIHLFKKIMPLLFMNFLVFNFGCGKVRNSSSNDASIYGSSVTGSANFLEARTVLAASCFSCHSNWANYNESQFVSANLVRANSLLNSSLYTRIRGNDTGIAGDMPQSNPNLSNDDMAKIKQWIQGI